MYSETPYSETLDAFRYLRIMRLLLILAAFETNLTRFDSRDPIAEARSIFRIGDAVFAEFHVPSFTFLRSALEFTSRREVTTLDYARVTSRKMIF